MNAQNPRQIALELLKQRRPGGSFTEDLLESALAHTALASADRNLCQELVYGVVRWQLTLDWLIARKTDGREQQPILRNLLRLGLYQIFWLDRIPDHAAVHETVELTRRSGFGAQAGFVNAVLRGYLREAGPTRKLLAELKVSEPALGWSHPQWLVTRWQKNFGAQKMAQLLEWNNTPPKTYARVNNLKFGGTGSPLPDAGGARGVARPALKNTGDLLAQWREEGVEYGFVPRDWLRENLVFELKSHPPLAKLTSFRQGHFYIQDPSTLLAVTELNPQPGETILDFCAAPGGKTTFMAQLMNNQGRIVAQDVSEERLKLVQENCQRLDVTCVEFCRSQDDEAQNRFTNPQRKGARKSAIVNPKSNRPSAIGHQQFDKILLDAPCSNTGVLRRRVDLRWRIRQGEIVRLQRMQLDLLKQAAPELKPGGLLVYSTCSLEPEENQEVVREFLRGHEEFKLETERELLPFVDDVDGAFVARLKRLP